MENNRSAEQTLSSNGEEEVLCWGSPAILGKTPALTAHECGRVGSMQATPPRSCCPIVSHRPSCSSSSYSQPRGMRQTRWQHLPGAKRWALGIPSLSPPVPGLDISSWREGVLQQTTGPRCI
ncbi:mCG146892 [Mus musculus]|nr:mCG146892 [Mus musculus]